MDETEIDHGSKTAEIPFPQKEMEKLEKEADLRRKEERLKTILNPYEGTVMSSQALLVWENPQRSIVLLLIVNGLVWLAVTSNYNVVFMVVLSIITAVTAHTFYKKVWPDIQVERNLSPDNEGWTRLDPDFVQFQDICHYSALAWQYFVGKNNKFWSLRKENPSKFCFVVCVLCLGIILLGQRVSGATITHLLVSGVIMVPGILYHNIHQQLYVTVKPFLTQMEHSMDVEMVKRKKHRGHPRKQKTSGNQDNTSSSDSELDEFMPTPGPALDAAFYHAAVTNEYTPGTSSRVTPVSGLIEGLMPRGASLEMTDEDVLTDNENSSLTFGPMESFPAYDDPDGRRVRRPRPLPGPSLVPHPPAPRHQRPPPVPQPRESLLTTDMAEMHFRAIPAGNFRSDSEPFSSDDLLDTSPEMESEGIFGKDFNEREGDNYDDRVDRRHDDDNVDDDTDYSNADDDDKGFDDVSSRQPNLESRPRPTELPEAATGLITRTVASVFGNTPMSHEESGPRNDCDLGNDNLDSDDNTGNDDDYVNANDDDFDESSSSYKSSLPVIEESRLRPAALPQAAMGLITQTVASVSAFMSRDATPTASRGGSESLQARGGSERPQSREGSESHPRDSARYSQYYDATDDITGLGTSAPSSLEPDLSDYEMLYQSEIDNARNVKTEEDPNDGSFREFLSNIFGRKA